MWLRKRARDGPEVERLERAHDDAATVSSCCKRPPKGVHGENKTTIFCIRDGSQNPRTCTHQFHRVEYLWRRSTFSVTAFLTISSLTSIAARSVWSGDKRNLSGPRRPTEHYRGIHLFGKDFAYSPRAKDSEPGSGGVGSEHVGREASTAVVSQSFPPSKNTATSEIRNIKIEEKETKGLFPNDVSKNLSPRHLGDSSLIEGNNSENQTDIALDAAVVVSGEQDTAVAEDQLPNEDAETNDQLLIGMDYSSTFDIQLEKALWPSGSKSKKSKSGAKSHASKHSAKGAKSPASKSTSKSKGKSGSTSKYSSAGKGKSIKSITSKYSFRSKGKSTKSLVSESKSKSKGPVSPSSNIDSKGKGKGKGMKSPTSKSRSKAHSAKSPTAKAKSRDKWILTGSPSTPSPSVSELGLKPTVKPNLSPSPTTSHPITSYPTTSYQTTSYPTSTPPTTPHPTKSSPTTSYPTTSYPTTSHPTATPPTTSHPAATPPTTSHPTTSRPTTSFPTTSFPTTSFPTTSFPTTSYPTTSHTTTYHPTKLRPTSYPTTSDPTTSDPTTSDPTTSPPTATPPTTSRPTTSHPTILRPETSYPTTSNPTTPHPTATPYPTTSLPPTNAPTLSHAPSFSPYPTVSTSPLMSPTVSHAPTITPYPTISPAPTSENDGASGVGANTIPVGLSIAYDMTDPSGSESSSRALQTANSDCFATSQPFKQWSRGMRETVVEVIEIIIEEILQYDVHRRQRFLIDEPIDGSDEMRQRMHASRNHGVSKSTSFGLNVRRQWDQVRLQYDRYKSPSTQGQVFENCIAWVSHRIAYNIDSSPDGHDAESRQGQQSALSSSALQNGGARRIDTDLSADIITSNVREEISREIASGAFLQSLRERDPRVVAVAELGDEYDIYAGSAGTASENKKKEIPASFNPLRISGIVVGAVICCTLLAGAALFFWKKTRQRQLDDGENSPGALLESEEGTGSFPSPSRQIDEGVSS